MEIVMNLFKPSIRDCKTLLTSLFLPMLILLSSVTNAQSIVAPAIQLVDRNHVNVASKQLALSQEDVSIGNGGLALSHGFSAYGLDMLNYNDSFFGAATKTQRMEYGTSSYIDMMTIMTRDDTVNFTIVNSTTYTAFNDPRYSLVLSGNTYIFTKPDGTEMRFSRYGSQINLTHGSARLDTIIYPNGFRVSISDRNAATRLKTVTTNNGLELLYIYASGGDSQGLSVFPQRIVALNNALTFCDTSNTNCNLANWPAVSYILPPFLTPQAMLSPGQDFVFTVTDSQNRKTEYYHTAYWLSGSAYYRLTSIVKAWDTVASINYTYGTSYHTRPTGYDLPSLQGYASIPTNTYALGNARFGSDQSVYNFGSPYAGSMVAERIGEPVLKVELALFYGVPVRIWTDKATFYKARSWANTLDRIEYNQGGVSTFTYDARLNLIEQKDNGVVVKAASYPACTSSNRKYCNKPSTIRDARNYTTYYSYHPESGQLAKVTSPAVNGVTAETRYQYQPYYAWYKNSSGSIVQSPTPIYLLAQESTCVKGNPSGAGCADPQDELITLYSYGTGSPSQANNLWLRGVEKITNGVASVLRTCHQYDIYGNRIAETTPKALLSSCPQ
jgi:hypothetical protein